MPKSDPVEFEKRIRVVQEWILEDWPSVDIRNQCVNKWGIGERMAKKYLSTARKRWVDQEQQLVHQKRKLKIESLKKLKRSLLSKYVGTPVGIQAVLNVEKEIIRLDGLEKPKQVQLSTKPGQPLQTENTSVVLYLPANGRDAKANH